MLCAAGTRRWEPCNEHPFCCHCLPANRAQGNAGPYPPFRLTHRSGRSAKGPTTSAPRRDRSSDRADYAWPSAGGIVDPSHGARAEKPRAKWFRSWTPLRGSVWKQAPVEWRPLRWAITIQGVVGVLGERRYQGRFQNIGRVVLCTRAGESSRQRPSGVIGHRFGI